MTTHAAELCADELERLADVDAAVVELDMDARTAVEYSTLGELREMDHTRADCSFDHNCGGQIAGEARNVAFSTSIGSPISDRSRGELGLGHLCQWLAFLARNISTDDDVSHYTRITRDGGGLAAEEYDIRPSNDAQLTIQMRCEHWSGADEVVAREL